MRYLLPFAFALLMISCGGNEKASEETTTDPETAAESGQAEGNKYVLTPFDQSTEFPTAKLETMKYENGDWSFTISGDYELGVQTPDAGAKGCANSAKGQHIHLIVGAAPYVAEYQTDFRHEIGDDKHAVLAFLSRSYHESIKTEDAYIARRLKIADGLVVGEEPLTLPTLFYSRPKGVYEGDDTEKVMLDYYMVNCDQEKHWVKADINGEIHELRDWQPYYIEGLPSGNNTITLTLMDDNGPVLSDNNPVSRTFQLNPEPPSN